MNKSKTRNYIFFIIYSAYVSIYAARINLSVAAPGLTELNILDSAKIGFLGSVFSTVYALGRMINGRISDNAPPWKMIAFGLAAAGISNICISFFPPYIGIFFLWTSNAYAQSMLWSSILYVVTYLYNKNEVKTKTSLMVTSVAAGNIVGIVLNTFLITNFGVNYAFLIPGTITLVLGGIVCICIGKIPNTGEVGENVNFFAIIKNKEISKMIVPAMFHGVIKENISLWMAVYVIDKYAVDLSVSSYYILLIPTIGFIGRILYPVILKICKERENIASNLGFCICAVASLIICLKSTGMILTVIAMSIIYASVSIVNTSMLSIYPLRFAQNGHTASVSGIMDFATYLGAGISSAVYGIVIKHFGYLPMFLSWIILSAVSVLIIYSIDKNEQKARRNF